MFLNNQFTFVLVQNTIKLFNLEDMDLSLLATKVAQIATKAGDQIIEIYENASDIEIHKKADDSPLTKADKAANQVICEGLERLEHLFPIVSEENKEVPYDVRSKYEYYWLVDPLDGTKEFIKRNGEFTVNIALIHQQRPILGVVYVPVTQKMYWAAKEVGAFEQRGEESFQLKAQSFDMKEEGLKVVCSRSHLNEDTQAFVDNLNQPELVAKGSSLKFLILAEGEAHLYPRLAPTMEWDTAAAQIVLEEAGGKVIDNVTRESLKYNKENMRNPHFVAYANLG